MFESVLLPAPFSPSSACTSPSAASKWTSSFATTPGKRFVMPWSSTAAGMKKGGQGARPCPPGISLALRAPLDALHQVVHRVELGERGLVPLGDAELALLVVDRAAELVPLAGLDQRLLLRDQRLRLGRHVRAVGRELREAVLQVAVVVARLPGAVHRCLGPLQVVRAPVVDGGREPRVRREL